ncbi:MAG: hypothetical protein HYT42_00535 [Candidatus Sungbacteria bacterium]|nr:hypothetical protein [Candidatus Sungbacteria bacterium]
MWYFRYYALHTFDWQGDGPSVIVLPERRFLDHLPHLLMPRKYQKGERLVNMSCCGNFNAY